jgi:hypothetical protein
MIVPKFWAEGRAHQPRHGKEGKQVTIRRFGWSDESETAAQAMADRRAREAFERAVRGEKFARREPKVSYNGAAGVPIREEIVATHGETVITRNLYGAQCLNTPNVLFADVDFDPQRGSGWGCLVSILLFLGSVLIGKYVYHLGAAGFLIGLPLAILGYWATYQLRLAAIKLRGGADKLARQRVQSFVTAHPGWQVRLYRTPAGIRALVTHRTFRPDEPEVTEFFNRLHADSLYVRMCRNQQCFRARLTPKPWRIGISGHLKPRPGVWPVKPERLPERRAWIADYEAKSRGFAACSFLETLGTGQADPAARAVQQLHDQLSRATSGLPIA